MVRDTLVFVPAWNEEENLAAVPGLAPEQDIVRRVQDPIKPTGHIQILHGNLAPDPPRSW